MDPNEPTNDRRSGRRRRAVVSTVGAAVVVASIVLILQDKHAGFATALALAGLAVVVLALIPEHVESIGGGGFQATLRAPEDHRRALEELSAEKATQAEVTVDEDDLLSADRYLATTRVLDHLLRPTTGPLAGCTLHLFEPDVEAGALVPIYEPDPTKAPSSWPIGVGVTGQAFQTEAFVLATGEHTHNSTHGLDSEEQAKHQDLLEVAALPVVNASDVTIAVLSVSNRVSHGVLSSPEGFEELVAIARAISRVLVDLLGTFDDGSK